MTFFLTFNILSLNFLAFCSLIRTFDCHRKYFRSKKLKNILAFSSLIRTFAGIWNHRMLFMMPVSWERHE